MLWLPLAFMAAVFEALRDAVLKKRLREIPTQVVAWFYMFFALPFLVPALLREGPTAIGPYFWIALITSGSLSVLAINLHIGAIQSEDDLSLTIPMVASTPLFLLFIGPLIIGETEIPTFWEIMGVLLVVVGAYVLNVHQRQEGFFGPYRALLTQRGPRYMLITGFLWSLVASIDKVGILNCVNAANPVNAQGTPQGNPMFWITAINTFLIVGMSPFMFAKGKDIVQVPGKLGFLVLVSLFFAMTAITQMYSVTLAEKVQYVIAVKRTNMIMGVILGHLMFKEQGFRERLAGVGVMLGGILMMLFL